MFDGKHDEQPWDFVAPCFQTNPHAAYLRVCATRGLWHVTIGTIGLYWHIWNPNVGHCKSLLVGGFNPSEIY